jgi:bifunctional UDP-N-acetylglucosamine pyrophosphorylase / glucosamine-1-phosphate N-acetyltransferase
LKNYEGMTIILCGDVPLLKAETILKLKDTYQLRSLDGVILTVELNDPKQYGRIVRDEQGLVKKIVEFRDASAEEKNIKEINSGIYCFNTKELFSALKKISTNNDQKEYYLTDVIEIFVSAGKKIGTYTVKDPFEVHGVNNIEDLQAAEQALLKR